MLLENLQQTQKQVKTSTVSCLLRQLNNNDHTNLYMAASSRSKHVTCYFHICPTLRLECILSCKVTVNTGDV